jgi:hypothetical protein
MMMCRPRIPQVFHPWWVSGPLTRKNSSVHCGTVTVWVDSASAIGCVMLTYDNVPLIMIDFSILNHTDSEPATGGRRVPAAAARCSG